MVGAIAGFNSPKEVNYTKDKNKVREESLTLKRAVNRANKTLRENDLSKIPNTAANWLEQHFQDISKIYKNKEKTLQYLQQMQSGQGISSNWLDNFINTVKNLYSKGPSAPLQYMYNCYLRGSNLGINETRDKENV